MTYQVSNLGRVKGASGKILKQRLNHDGYCVLTMGKKGKRVTKFVHRLVAETFIPNPDSLDTVNHIDFDRANNNIDNLEWLSHHDNILYSVEAGRYDEHKKGECNGRAILTEKDVVKIRKLYEQGVQKYKIAKKYNRGWSTIHNVIERNTWKHIA